MNTIHQMLIRALACSSLVLAACTSADAPERSAVEAVAYNHGVGQSMGAYEMRLVQRPDAESSARLRALVEIVSDRVGDWTQLDHAITNARGQRTGLLRPFSDIPSIVVEHDSEIDMVRVLNERPATAAPEGIDVGEVQARNAMASAFDRLAARGLLRAADYDLSTASVGHDRAANGSRDGSQHSEWTLSYRFSLRRRVGGIPVLNSGVQIAVHRSGTIDSIRLGGVELSSQGTGASERPAGAGRLITRSVADSEIQARFRASLPPGADAAIRFEGLAYVLPEGVRTAVVEPLYVFAYSTIRESGGQRLGSRLQTVGYSILDPSAPPRTLFETVDPAIGATPTASVRTR